LPKTKAVISVENVVATGNLSQSIDLIQIKKTFKHTEYNPERFPGLVYRLKIPKTSTLIFRTGKMVCTGSRSEEQSEVAINLVVKQLKAGGVKIKNKPVCEVQNIVASVDLGGQIDLEEVARQLPRCMYEPEQFPGVILRASEPKAVFLIFSSGKLVCTGSKREKDIYTAVKKLHTGLEDKDLMIY
tara:strand:- start:214 stop:771 length:558 start_codon:yes stop_codon:yes gene_type:complete